MNPIIHVVDDEAKLRRSLELLLRSEGFHVQIYASSEEFLARFNRDVPGCLVLDVYLGGMSGLDLQRELCRQRLLIPVVVMSAHPLVPNVVTAMRSGAIDFLEKPFSDADLIDRVREAIRIDIDGENAPFRIRTRVNSLSPREREVMELLLEGCNTKTIAHRMGVSLQTVDKHRGRVFGKMNVDSLIGLYRALEESGALL